MGTRVVRTPTGEEWRIGRRLTNRRLPRWRRPRMKGSTAESAFWSAPGPLPDDLEGLGLGLLVLLAVVVVAVVLVPLLLFGLELILLGLIVAAGILGRTLLGRAWVVQATRLDAEPRILAWGVVGWRRSARVIDEVAAALGSGLDPSPSEATRAVPAQT
jgi:hypothetical protein